MTFAAIRHALLILADECDGGREYAEISELLSAWEVRCAMGKKFTIVRREHHGSSLDDFLESKAVLEFEAVAREQAAYKRGFQHALTEIKSFIRNMEEE